MYPKIMNVFRRDDETHRLTREFSMPMFEELRDIRWYWTEKIDGMNIRVIATPDCYVIKGRTDRAQLPLELTTRIYDLLPVPHLFSEGGVFAGLEEVTIFGEGYGAKIQEPAGSRYSPQPQFIVFDMLARNANGSFWFCFDAVRETARHMGLKTVPVIGTGPLLSAVELVRQGFISNVSEQPQQAEGIVARSVLNLFAGGTQRVIAKIKTKDLQLQLEA